MLAEATFDFPNPEDDEWMAAMRRGDFARAWEISDDALREHLASGAPSLHLPRHLQQIWRGDSLAGKRVLVRCYHGLGDTIQFIRFAARLRDIAREVIVWVQPQLMTLVATAPGVDRVLPLHDGAPEADYDADIEVMELPYALRVEVDNVPAEVPYLFPPTTKPLPLGTELNVGIVWEAGDWDSRRSIPAQMVQELRGVSGIRLHSLQRGAASAFANKIADSNISTDDVTLAAARIQQLDLVIAVDTMVGHLAGALGVPVWLMLHARCDWRWMNGDHSVWYPTMRLFRQPVLGDCLSVIQKVRAALMQKAIGAIPA